MKVRLAALLTFAISFALPTFAQHPPPAGHFVTFDPPGSTFTVPSAITAAGVVLGSYSDSSGAQHGFLRNADGRFTTFDPPGSTLTTATAINPAGTVTGAYNDAADVDPRLHTNRRGDLHQLRRAERQHTEQHLHRFWHSAKHQPGGGNRRNVLRF